MIPVLALASCSVLLNGWNPVPKPDTNPPPTSSYSWSTLPGNNYNNGLTLQPLQGGEIYFDFPQNPGHVNMIEHRWQRGSVAVGDTVTITYRIRTLSGTPVFKSLEKGTPGNPGLPPNFRPMVYNGDWLGSGSRWWSNGQDYVILVADGQIHTFSVKLDPNTWTDVIGAHYPAMFTSVISNVYAFQIDFGGANAFSHGVRVEGGTARFELISFKVGK